jgi:hypothetical protein
VLVIDGYVLLLDSRFTAREIEEEIEYLKQLDSLGIKTPRRYKQIVFVNESDSNIRQHGLVVQKIKGAQEIKLNNVVECFVGKALVAF